MSATADNLTAGRDALSAAKTSLESEIEAITVADATDLAVELREISILLMDIWTKLNPDGTAPAWGYYGLL